MSVSNIRHYLKCVGALALALAAATGMVSAQTTKPLTIVVAYPTGGSTDVMARILADKMRVSLNRPVLVDNKPGAGGRLGAGIVKNMAADGSTILFGMNALVLQSIIYEGQMNFDLVRDFAPVAKAVRIPLAIAVPANSDIRTIADLKRYTSTNKNDSNYGSSGPGTIGHLTGLRLANATGIEWTHVPYKGGAPLLNDLLGGHVLAGVDALAEYVEYHRTGRIRVLAVFGSERSSQLPDVPTITELGVKGIDTEAWWGFWAPGKTPAPVVEQLQESIRLALQDPEVVSKLNTLTAEVSYLPSQEYGALVKGEFDLWRPLVSEAKLTPE